LERAARHAPNGGRGKAESPRQRVDIFSRNGARAGDPARQALAVAQGSMR
jgi:hypothetical protein